MSPQTPTHLGTLPTSGLETFARSPDAISAVFTHFQPDFDAGRVGSMSTSEGIQRVKIVKNAIFVLMELSETTAPFFCPEKPSELDSEVGNPDFGRFQPFPA